MQVLDLLTFIYCQNPKRPKSNWQLQPTLTDDWQLGLTLFSRCHNTHILGNPCNISSATHATYPRQPLQHILGNPCNISSATDPHLNLPLRTRYRHYLALSHQSYQTKPTKPNLPNQTYQTKPTKPKLIWSLTSMTQSCFYLKLPSAATTM